MAEVICMGDILVEIMRPEAGIPLNREGYFRGPFPSGAPAIFIDTVAKMDHTAAIIGGVGDDDFGHYTIDRMRADGVDCRFIHLSDRLSTGCAFVTYFEDGSRKFIFHMGNSAAAEVDIPDISDMDDLKYFHIMGTSLADNPKFADGIVGLMRAAVKKGAKVSFDPNLRFELIRDRRVYEIIDEIVGNTAVLLPGKEELMIITGEDSVEKAIKKAFENPVLEVIALKNGSKGSIIYTRENSFESDIYTIDVADATGAGDSYAGGFIAGLLENRPLEECAKMAAACGALNCAAFGPMEGKISPEIVWKMIEERETE
jgi:sugar/nucleoside kinase (ribokinase family)